MEGDGEVVAAQLRARKDGDGAREVALVGASKLRLDGNSWLCRGRGRKVRYCLSSHRCCTIEK